jgi:glycerol kinase
VNILAIDQGTSATKAILVGPGMKVLGTGEAPVRPRAVADAVEADPEELYASVLAAGQAALAEAGARPDVMALANQGETVLAWDRQTGRPLTAAISWQDRRSAVVCARLSGHAARLAEITGLPLDPYFAAPKMTWLRENLTDDGVVTTTDTWLLARLGAGYVTDAATASRTMLLDLDVADWSDEACAIFGIDPLSLPTVTDCAGVVGETTAFGRPLPVAGLIVDQQAALLAEHCFEAGQAKCTYGTGAFLLAFTGGQPVRSSAGLSASVAWRLAGSTDYCLDGQVYTAGSAIDWLISIGILTGPAELDGVGGTVPDAGGVVFLPALAGLGAPYWRPDARGAFLGLTLAASKAHLIRAAVDGLAASVALLARSVATDLGAPLTALRVDGGLTRSRLLLQAQADLLQVPVEVCRIPDATALGVAALARLGVGAAHSLAEAVGPADVQAVLQPRMSADEAGHRIASYESALTSILGTEP